MSKVIPELLRNFTVELAHPEKDWRVVNHWYIHAPLHCHPSHRLCILTLSTQVHAAGRGRVQAHTSEVRLTLGAMPCSCRHLASALFMPGEEAPTVSTAIGEGLPESRGEPTRQLSQGTRTDSSTLCFDQRNTLRPLQLLLQKPNRFQLVIISLNKYQVPRKSRAKRVTTKPTNTHNYQNNENKNKGTAQTLQK